MAAWTNSDGLIQRLSTKTLRPRARCSNGSTPATPTGGRWQIIAPPAAGEVIDYADAKKLPLNPARPERHRPRHALGSGTSPSHATL